MPAWRPNPTFPGSSKPLGSQRKLACRSSARVEWPANLARRAAIAAMRTRLPAIVPTSRLYSGTCHWGNASALPVVRPARPGARRDQATNGPIHLSAMVVRAGTHRLVRGKETRTPERVAPCAALAGCAQACEVRRGTPGSRCGQLHPLLTIRLLLACRRPGSREPRRADAGALAAPLR